MASPEEGLMPFRSDPGLGGASLAAMMRPSCCKDGSTWTSPFYARRFSLTGIAAAVPVMIGDCTGVPLEHHSVVTGQSLGRV